MCAQYGGEESQVARLRWAGACPSGEASRQAIHDLRYGPITRLLSALMPGQGEDAQNRDRHVRLDAELVVDML